MWWCFLKDLCDNERMVQIREVATSLDGNVLSYACKDRELTFKKKKKKTKSLFGS